MQTFMGQLLRCFGVRRANPAGAGNGAATVLLHLERPCRAVPDHERWAKNDITLHNRGYAS